MNTLTPLLHFTERLARQSGEVIAPLFGKKELEITSKSDDTPVTFADREAERVMRCLIEEHYPTHGIIGEEFGQVRTDAEWVWVLDPVDGTKTFVTGVPLFGTLIGLLHRGKPAIGCIHQPVLNQLLLGDNQTTTLNGHPIRVRPCASLAQATVLTTDEHTFRQGSAEAAGWARLAAASKMVRTWGDAYGYLLVASGWADVMCDPVMAPWDLLPLLPVLRGAGCTVTDWYGNEPDTASSCLVACPELHPLALAKLNRG